MGGSLCLSAWPARLAARAGGSGESGLRVGAGAGGILGRARGETLYLRRGPGIASRLRVGFRGRTILNRHRRCSLWIRPLALARRRINVKLVGSILARL